MRAIGDGVDPHIIFTEPAFALYFHAQPIDFEYPFSVGMSAVLLNDWAM